MILCKYSEQLDTEMKKIVKSEIESMRAKVKDNFLKEMLLKAFNNLK